MVVTSNCVITLSYIFYIFQHWNLIEKGLFCRRFHRLERPLEKNFRQIEVEENLTFLLTQILLKYSKKGCETAAAPRVFPRRALVDHPPLSLSQGSLPYFYTSTLFLHVDKLFRHSHPLDVQGHYWDVYTDSEESWIVFPFNQGNTSR